MSDHGFHSFRQSVNLNTWLVQEGFMTLQGQAPGEKKLHGSVRRRRRSGRTSTGRTRSAYAMGLGQIYINLQGREGHGIVAPAPNPTRSQNAIVGRLLTLTDPKTNARMVDAVYKRDDIYKGPFVGERRGAAGRPRRRLPRLVADDARRLAAGHRLSEHEEVVGRPRLVRLQADARAR